MRTFKLHYLGDYVYSIQHTGATESDMTMIVRSPLRSNLFVMLMSIDSRLKGEVAHRKSKHRYDRTSKRNYILQLADIERREARIEEITQGVTVDAAFSVPMVASEKPSTVSFLRDPTLLPSTSTAAARGPARTVDDVPDGEGEDIPLDVHHHIASSQNVMNTCRTLSADILRTRPLRCTHYAGVSASSNVLIGPSPRTLCAN